MKLPWYALADLLLALWIAVAAAQGVALFGAACWWPAGLAERVRPDLRLGYYVLGGLLLAFGVARHIAAREVAGDR